MSEPEEKIVATKNLLLFGNLTLAIWIALGTASCLLINPWLGWFFLVFSSFTVFVIIRRLLCNTCYYCKSCTKGFAKLSVLSLGSNRILGISKGSTLGMAGAMYFVLTVIPSLFLADSLTGKFSWASLLLLVALVSLTAYTLIVRVMRGYR